MRTGFAEGGPLMSRHTSLALLALLMLCASAEAHSRGRNRFILDYPLIRPFVQSSGFNGYGGGGGYYLPPVPTEASGLVKATGLIDEYIAEQRVARELHTLRLDNEEIQDRVGSLERKLAAGRPAERARRSR